MVPDGRSTAAPSLDVVDLRGGHLIAEAILVARPDGVTTASHGWTAVTGLPAAEALGDGWISVLDPASQRLARFHLEEALRTGESCAGEGRLGRREDVHEIRWCIRPVPDRDGSSAGAVISLSLFRGEERARPRPTSVLDPITRLTAEGRFKAQVQHALLRMTRHGGRIAVLHIRLPGIGPNGRGDPDRDIAAIVGRFRAVLRPIDVLTVVDPVDILVLCEQLTLVSEGRATAMRLLRTLDAGHSDDGTPLSEAIAVGVAVTDDPGITPDALVDRAAVVMAEARQRRRGPVSSLIRRSHRERMGIASMPPPAAPAVS